MRTLLWKDYHQNRKVLAAIAVILLIPYGISIVVAMIDLYSGHTIQRAQLLQSGSRIALFLSAGITSFIAGNAIAGERADRSAEFAAYLPISRRHAVASKIIVAIGACLFFILINGAVNLAAVSMVFPDYGYPLSVLTDAVVYGGPAVLLMFGVAWLLSSFSRSPAISAVSGLAAFLVLMGSAGFGMSDHTGRISDSWWYWYWSTSLVAGGGGFVVGVIYYLRRVEP